MVRQQCSVSEPVCYATKTAEIDRLEFTVHTDSPLCNCTMLMKEYRICMPLTVDEVSVFVFPTLSHKHTSYNIKLKDKRGFFYFYHESVVSTCNLKC